MGVQQLAHGDRPPAAGLLRLGRASWADGREGRVEPLADRRGEPYEVDSFAAEADPLDRLVPLFPEAGQGLPSCTADKVFRPDAGVPFVGGVDDLVANIDSAALRAEGLAQQEALVYRREERAVLFGAYFAPLGP